MAYQNKVGSASVLDSILSTSSSGDPIQRQVNRYMELQSKANKTLVIDKSKLEEALKKKQHKEDLKAAKELQQEINALTDSNGKKFVKNLSKQLLTMVDKVSKAMTSSIDSYIKTYTQYMGTITTRLQNTGMTYNSLLRNVSTQLATSPYFKQSVMIENLNKFVESGVAYNLETRSFIATAADKIATTFDAFDSSLLRLIRIQQADSTVARIGMESLLTKFLNQQFQDTSYLNQTSKQVSSALLEAESLMGYQRGAEFEYAAQRWLGSMQASGVSENLIQSLATGLGYLGSGNVSALAGNTALQNLLVMAASQAGLDYGSLLTGGVSTSNVNALFEGIMKLSSTIQASGNNVVLSQYANLFGLSVSDIMSLGNITGEIIDVVKADLRNYEQLRTETEQALSTVGERTTISEKVENVISNVMTRIGAEVATSPFAYGTWKVADLLSASGLDYQIKASPFGVGMDTSLSQLLKTGVVGISTVTSIVDVLGSLLGGRSTLGGNSLRTWNEAGARGSGLATTGLAGYGEGESMSGYLGVLGSRDIATFGGLDVTTTHYTNELDYQEEIKNILSDTAFDIADIKMAVNAISTKVTGV